MKSILIVISAPNLRDRLSNILSQAGYHIIAAESGERAIDLAPTVNPELVLVAIGDAKPQRLANGSPVACKFRFQNRTNSLAGNCHPYRHRG